MLDIIAFLPCLTREDCSFPRLLPLVSGLKDHLNNSSSGTLTSERSEFSRVSSVSSRSTSSPGSPGSSRWCWSGRIGVCSPSSKGSVGVKLAAPASASHSRHYLDSSHFLVSLRSLKDHDDLHLLLHKQKRP